MRKQPKPPVVVRIRSRKKRSFEAEAEALFEEREPEIGAPADKPKDVEKE
jgi:hypothetical protein